jgi:hypothetical protein
LLLLLTRRIVEMPFEQTAIMDFRQILLSLYTRNCVFFCQTCSSAALNVEDMRVLHPNGEFMFNRDYAMFCTIYFNQLFRRIHYYDTLKSKIFRVTTRNTEDIQDWVKYDICEFLGVEGVEDTYAQACDGSFNFPGDEEWFKYKYVERAIERGPILNYVRPAQAQIYFSPNVISQDPILAATQGFREDREGICARMFVLMAIDQRFRSVYGLYWLNAILIKNNKIEHSRNQLLKSPFPCLVQVLCGFWVYSRGKIYPTNNIYETIYTWFYILRKEYNSTILKIDLTQQINSLLDNNSDGETAFQI